MRDGTEPIVCRLVERKEYERKRELERGIENRRGLIEYQSVRFEKFTRLTSYLTALEAPRTENSSPEDAEPITWVKQHIATQDPFELPLERDFRHWEFEQNFVPNYW